jgi:hypothetical protein
MLEARRKERRNGVDGGVKWRCGSRERGWETYVLMASIDMIAVL